MDILDNSSIVSVCINQSFFYMILVLFINRSVEKHGNETSLM